MIPKLNPQPATMDEIISRWKKCTKCVIGKWATNHVFFRGLPDRTPILFIGEGPGREEDKEGLPFIGRSGELLARAMHTAGIDAGTYSVTNLVCCRPCDTPNGFNRAPAEIEVINCSPRLLEMLYVLQPRVVVLLGKNPSIHWRDRYRHANNLNITHAFYLRHPAYLLRKGAENADEFTDMVEELRRVKEAAQV